MNRYVVGFACLWMAGLVATTAQAQCQSGGRGGSAGSSGGMVASSARSLTGSGSSMLTSPGSWAYDQMLGQALARQMAQQAYQKQLADQARRAESLAKRQYWAAQRRAQKAPSATSPGNLFAANSRSSNTAGYSTSMSLDILPSGR
jgi:hypothetical protein